MKLTTIARDGEPCPALVLTNDDLRARWCLDLRAANRCLASNDWGVVPIADSLLAIIEGGLPALDNLRRLQEVLLRELERGDRDLFGQALLAPDSVSWLPPLPNCPLFMTFHGNGIGNWRDRAVAMSSRAITSRVPACRLHPEPSHLGHLEPLIFAEGEAVPYGNELGVVIAPGGKDISYEEAQDHVWGITNCNDVTRGSVWPKYFGPPEQWSKHEGECKARLARASDASCPSGPWITTIDEVPDVLDLLMYTWGPDGGYNRAHSWAYIMGPRNVLAYFSRFMTWPAGAVLQLAAPGVDGVGAIETRKAVHGQCLEVSCERVGTLTNPIWCEGETTPQRAAGNGWYDSITRVRGIDLAQAYGGDQPPFPQHTRTIWTVRYNDALTAESPEYDRSHRRHYEICPRATLSTGEPVEIPPHGDRVEVSCELAAVVGRRPIGRVDPQQVEPLLEGWTIMIGLRDFGLFAELDAPTDRETIFSALFGRWYDGFNAARPQLMPADQIGSVSDLEMRLQLDGVGEVVSRTSDYVEDISQVISFLSNEITLLPGDVVSLGSSGAKLVIEANQKLPADARLQASIEGLGEFIVPLRDRRGAHLPLHQVV